MPNDTGLADVQKLVAERTGKRIAWNRGAEPDKQMDAYIQDALQKELSADEVVQIALLNNRILQASYEDMGVAQADLIQAGLLKNPVFDALIRFPDKAPKGPNVEFSVTQDFMDILFIPARKKLAASQLEKIKLTVAAAVLNHAAETSSAYYRLQGALQMIDLRRTVVLASEISIDVSQHLFDAGNITDLSLASDQAAALQAKLDLADAQAQALEDRERLNVLMGIAGNVLTLKIPDRLPDLPKEDIDFNNIEPLAIAQRLDLAAAKRQVEVAATELGLSRQYWFLPELSIGIDTERDPGGTHVTGPRVSTIVPIFDQGQAKLAIGEAKLRQARLLYQGLSIEIQSQVRLARSRMMSARSRAENYRTALLPLRAKIVEQTQLQFNGMFVSVFQLLQAKQAQIDAGREYIEALRSYWIARSELEKYAGGSLKGLTLESPDTIPVSTQPAPSSNDSKTQQPQHNHGD